MNVRISLIAISLLALGKFATAETPNHSHSRSTYAGEEARDIKALSNEDIDDLRNGRGWGLAKPAELNGLPGPAHLLELKDQIPLSPRQVALVEALYAEMKRQAVAEGERLIALERNLEQVFRTRTVTEGDLERLLVEIEKSRASLRLIHLATHLKTPAILSAKQIARYNDLRGYSISACDSVPKGHDVAMWRKHNGCE
jgi:hypothetical protein